MVSSASGQMRKGRLRERCPLERLLDKGRPGWRAANASLAGSVVPSWRTRWKQFAGALRSTLGSDVSRSADGRGVTGNGGDDEAAERACPAIGLPLATPGMGSAPEADLRQADPDPVRPRASVVAPRGSGTRSATRWIRFKSHPQGVAGRRASDFSDMPFFWGRSAKRGPDCRRRSKKPAISAGSGVALKAGLRGRVQLNTSSLPAFLAMR